MSKKITQYEGGVDAGLVVVGDPFELLQHPFKQEKLKRLRKRINNENHITADGLVVLMKVSEGPCSFKVSFRKGKDPYERSGSFSTKYYRIILSDKSYDTNRVTTEDRILTKSGWFVFTDPCYIIYENDQEGWTNWLKHSMHKYDDKGYMLYSTFDRDDGDFYVSEHKNHIEVDSVRGYADPLPESFVVPEDIFHSITHTKINVRQ